MTDRLTPQQRSRVMSRVRSRDTTPERSVRSTLHRLGFRFRLHAVDLPGRPDIVLRKHRTAIFVHGCFWHSHDCRAGRPPATRVEFWTAKLAATRSRDERATSLLHASGWQVIVVWECQTRNASALFGALAKLTYNNRTKDIYGRDN
ncbi:MAG: very short patch repair endonuclease [Bauldia sp.]